MYPNDNPTAPSGRLVQRRSMLWQNGFFYISYLILPIANMCFIGLSL